MSKETNCRNIRNNKHEIQTEKRTVGNARRWIRAGNRRPASKRLWLWMKARDVHVQLIYRNRDCRISALMYHGHVALNEAHGCNLPDDLDHPLQTDLGKLKETIELSGGKTKGIVVAGLTWIKKWLAVGRKKQDVRVTISWGTDDGI
ncbi:hypothetical protein IW261DRAFT_1427082 [Armillaria novae-zelandiae]|uniref:Uncharacterized protein n=1 Tax=Armillaria novae-zelandiae TaxID=153914 RepID=A0AA39NHI9_9AGAR|nr:hypothetical protein IW261DRAFT_1427082 [Armillaria novae-zelandiae]